MWSGAIWRESESASSWYTSAVIWHHRVYKAESNCCLFVCGAAVHGAWVQQHPIFFMWFTLELRETAQSLDLTCMLFDPFSGDIVAMWRRLVVLKNSKFVSVLKGQKRVYMMLIPRTIQRVFQNNQELNCIPVNPLQTMIDTTPPWTTRSWHTGSIASRGLRLTQCLPLTWYGWYCALSYHITLRHICNVHPRWLVTIISWSIRWRGVSRGTAVVRRFPYASARMFRRIFYCDTFPARPVLN